MAADLLLEHRALRSFLGALSGVLARTQDPTARIRALLEPFRHLLMEDFLAAEFRQAPPGEYRQYLIYRSSDRSVSLIAKAVAPGVTVPTHDHQTWGIRGVYQGVLQETVYQRQDDGSVADRALLTRVRRQRLRPGDITGILPPVADIHALEATSKVSAVSVMVMGADIGCRDRNAFDARTGAVRPFRIAYANADCGM
jgi:predicted metal-dependent enzyme (double-stranded beta helix superfamily)